MEIARRDEAAAPARTDGGSADRRRELLDELLILNHRIADGDEDAIPRLGKVLDQIPMAARIFADPGRLAEEKMIATYAGDDAVAHEALPRTLKAMREELGGPDPSPLERLLVDRVVTTWFQVQYFEAHYFQNINGSTIPQHNFWQKRIDRAHGRHLSALKTLAQIRKLGPKVQINIAEQQIVNASDGATRR